MALKRFTKAKFLEQIGRGLLRGLVARYQAEFAGGGVLLPDERLGDREYYAALARLALREHGLPERFIEALYGIEAMADEYGKGRLKQAADEAGLSLENVQQGTYADFAVQVLLADADLFRQKLDETRMGSLSSFEYYGSEEPLDRRATFAPPDAAGLARIKGDIDNWVSAAMDGDERATEVEWHEVDGEHWFLIRRGAALARVPMLEGGVFTVRRSTRAVNDQSRCALDSDFAVWRRARSETPCRQHICVHLCPSVVLLCMDAAET
jgi:hypothetical protein